MVAPLVPPGESSPRGIFVGRTSSSLDDSWQSNLSPGARPFVDASLRPISPDSLCPRVVEHDKWDTCDTV